MPPLIEVCAARVPADVKATTRARILIILVIMIMFMGLFQIGEGWGGSLETYTANAGFVAIVIVAAVVVACVVVAGGGGSGGGFHDLYVGGGFDGLASYGDGGTYAEAELRGGTFFGEAASKGFEGFDSGAGEEFVEVGADTQGNGGGFLGVDGVVLVGGAGSEFLGGYVECPIHGGKKRTAVGWVFDSDVDVEGEGDAFGSDGGSEHDDIGGGDLAFGYVANIDACNGDVGDVLE